jgi:glycosyltransferase involved in cell wall biosynthesis
VTSAAFVLDPCAWIPTGHHLQFDLALRDELGRALAEAWLYVHREATGRAVGHPAVIRHFSVFPGKPLFDDPLVGDLETYLEQNRAFLADLRAFAADVDLSDALLIFPNVLHHMLLGLAEWLGEQGTAQGLRPVLVFPGYSGYETSPGATSWLFALYRHGFNALRRAVGDAPTLLALTAEQAAEYSFLAGRPVEVAPYPTVASLCRAPDLPAAGGRPPRVVFLGGSSARKGFNLLPEIVASTLRARPDVEFVIQVNVDGVSRPDQEIVRALRGIGPAVRLREGYADQESFFETIREGDVVLLPYQSPMYRSGSSALFEDAAYLGRACVVPPETSMATALAAGSAAGRVAGGTAAEDFATALIAALADREQLAQAAASIGERRRATSGMDRFAQRLLQIA